MQVVKINLQNTDKRLIGGVVDLLRILTKAHGWQGLYLGLRINLAKDVIFGSMYLGSYGECRKRLPDTPVGHFLSGGLASLVLWTPLYPLDLIKTQIQSMKHLTVADALRHTIKERGVPGLWRGIGMIYLRVFPTSACSMLAYEGARKMLHVDNN